MQIRTITQTNGADILQKLVTYRQNSEGINTIRSYSVYYIELKPRFESFSPPKPMSNHSTRDLQLCYDRGSEYYDLTRLPQEYASLANLNERNPLSVRIIVSRTQNSDEPEQ